MILAVRIAETLAVFLVIFYLYCRSPAFKPLRPDWPRPGSKIRLYLVFSGIAILGNYLGVPVVGGAAIVNARAVGAVLGGLLGGPVVGFLVGFTAGIHRITALSGIAAISGAVATTMEGLMGGLVYLILRNRPDRLMTMTVAFTTTFVGEILHMGIVLLFTRPYDQAMAVVQIIGPPMILANPVGAALFMAVFLERERERDRVAATWSAKALHVAERSLGLMARGFGPEAASAIAKVVREETGVGAVAITDTERVLGWAGIAGDHHNPGDLIASPFTRQSIEGNEPIFADGVHQPYACRVSKHCPLQSVFISPLQVDGAVLGTVQLFEPESRRFQDRNKTLGQGIGTLLSSQLLLSRYQQQKDLLVKAELKLLHAQVNPHFLFNALNTIIAVTRTNPGRARELLVHLSLFFRKNLKRSSDYSTLKEELEHVGAYLEIEKARFLDRLQVEIDVDPSLLTMKLPTFTLQPLIENAIKHGFSETMGPITARIRARREGEIAWIDVEDNAGAYHEPIGDGLGMKIVDQRLKNLLGSSYGISIHCVPHEITRITVKLPAQGVEP